MGSGSVHWKVRCWLPNTKMLITHIQYKIKNILKHEVIIEQWTNVSSEIITFVSHKHLENNLNHWNL